jgi:hypothetical protein
MAVEASPNYFDRARAVAAAFLIAAGASVILGAFLDWVSVTPPEVVPPNQAEQVQPFSGIETSDGWIVIVAGAILVVCGIVTGIRRSSVSAMVAFGSAIVIGAIGIADYRGIEDLFYRELNRVGDPVPAVGIMLVVGGAIVGLLSAAMALAASPRRL